MSRLNLIKNIWDNRENLDFDHLQYKAKAFSRMVPLMIKGEYKPKHKASIIIGVGAIVYAVSPIDLIPDFVPFGLLDDFVILGYGLKKVNSEVDRFLKWEEEQQRILLNR